MLPIDPDPLKGVILDVDGTLYRQGPVRRGMLCRLLRTHAGQLRQGWLTFQVLQAYRRAQETLRESGPPGGDLVEAQVRLAAAWTKVDVTVVRGCVARWMEREPLELVARSVREGGVEFLRAARDRGLRLGVFSDYPPFAKLEAMGVAQFFEAIVCAQDPEVQRFKPDPRGLALTLKRLGVEKTHVLCIGDRPEVDGLAAVAAGIACVIIGRRGRRSANRGWFELSGYRELTEMIWPASVAAGRE